MTVRGELLRAAETLRRYARAVPPGPWRAAVGSVPSAGVRTAAGWEVTHASYGDSGPAVVAYIALMDPTVAGLVADLLDEAAGQHLHYRDSGGERSLWDEPWMRPHLDVQPCIRLARAINHKENDHE